VSIIVHFVEDHAFSYFLAGWPANGEAVSARWVR
jgi:hypothetical protein